MFNSTRNHLDPPNTWQVFLKFDSLKYALGAPVNGRSVGAERKEHGKGENISSEPDIGGKEE